MMTQYAGRCILCGQSGSQKLFPIDRYVLVECTACGMQSLDPAPDELRLRQVYADYYAAWGADRFDGTVSAMKKKTFQSYLDRLPVSAVAGRLLDIGCATGELLQVARGMGFDVYGVEISPEGIQRSREQFGQDRIVGEQLRREHFPEMYFDVITLADVLEHVPDPRSFLALIAGLLKPNGVVMVITPDTASWTRRLLGRWWPHYKIEHLYYYSRNNIQRLAGDRFYPLCAEPVRKTLTVGYVLSVLGAYAQKGFSRGLVRLLERMPGRVKALSFRIHIGEMFVLMEKKDA